MTDNEETESVNSNVKLRERKKVRRKQPLDTLDHTLALSTRTKEE